MLKSLLIYCSCYFYSSVFVKVNTSDETAGSTPRYFKGLFIMARTDADDGELDNTTNHGTFNVMSDADLATYPCYSMPDVCIFAFRFLATELSKKLHVFVDQLNTCEVIMNYR